MGFPAEERFVADADAGIAPLDRQGKDELLPALLRQVTQRRRSRDGGRERFVILVRGHARSGVTNAPRR